MNNYYIMYSGGTEIIINGPYTRDELIATLKRDYDECALPAFADKMPTGSLSYLHDQLVVFSAEIIVPIIETKKE